MANRWYAKQDGQELGPFSESGLRRFLASDQARPGVLIRSGSAGEWLAPSQAGIAGSASVAAAPVRSSNASGGNPTEIVEPIENLPFAAGPKPFWSRPATRAAAGAGFLALLSAACVGAWFLAKHLNGERQTAAAPAPASPATNPAVADLEQETNRLRKELAELQNKMRDSPAPESNPPPGSDLAEERAALAKEIALEMARQEDLQERFNYEIGLQTDAADAGVDLPPYQSQRDARYAIHLPVVELELSKLDRAGLAARRAAFEQAASDRAKRIEQIQSRLREAVAALDVDLAGQTLKQVLPLVDGDDYEGGSKLLRQLADARVENLLEYVNSMSEDERQALADQGPTPADLMRQFTDRKLILAVQTHLPQVASLAIAKKKNIAWNQAHDKARERIDLTMARKWKFLLNAFLAKQRGELTPARAVELVETFGAFRLEGEPPLLDGMLTAFPQSEEANRPFALFRAYSEGAILQSRLTDLYAECRELAAGAWPPDDQTHPLAGHWADRSKWHIYVDPSLDTIIFTRAKQRSITQRICKVGSDYLVAFEKRLLPNYESKHVIEGDPFYDGRENAFENFFASSDAAPETSNKGRMLDYSVVGKGQYLTFSLYLPVKDGRKSLRIRRKEVLDPNLALAEFFGVENTGWKKLGDLDDYKELKLRFHYVDDRLEP